jgi:hypothetical protein
VSLDEAQEERKRIQSMFQRKFAETINESPSFWRDMSSQYFKEVSLDELD